MRIAVIGSGIGGLSAAWALNRHHDVVLYEAEQRLGGHSNTLEVEDPGFGRLPVDTGFIVFNDLTYPNLTRLFDHLGQPVENSTMSFAVSLGGGAYEYSGDGLNGVFAQRSHLLRASHYRMIRDILRFYRDAPQVLETPDDRRSIGAFLRDEGYGDAFIDRHLMPMGAAIWSATVDRMLAFPARSLVQFMHNHGLLGLRNRPQWRTVTGGSRQYVRRLADTLRGRIRSGCPVVAVRREGGTKVRVRDARGGQDLFDHVVIGAHADQALAMLEAPTAAERRWLGAFRYSDNRAVLHSDARLMPRRRRVWASWNYIGTDDARAPGVAVTYWMNRLQNLPGRTPFFVTLNPVAQPDPDQVHARMVYTHPQFDLAALAAQEQLWEIQGVDRISYCGSYFGWGFHEDGIASGLAVADDLGAPRPWVADEVSPAGRNARRRPMAAPAVAA